MSTNVGQFISDLNAGIVEEKLSRVISDVANAVTQGYGNGKVKIDLTFSQIGQSNQVTVEHKISYSKPTQRGKATEEDTTETPMHVGAQGRVTLFPEDQGQFFTKHGDIVAKVGA